MSKTTELVSQMAKPFVEAAGCELWDVEFVKEAGTWVLRVTIDKEGGVSIDDCEAVSRPLSDALDEADPIESSYSFEVSSPGIDRVLKKPEHFQRFLGERVEARLYRPRNGSKRCTGILEAWQEGALTLALPEGSITFAKGDVAQVRLCPPLEDAQQWAQET